MTSSGIDTALSPLEALVRRRCADLRRSLQEVARTAGISRSHLYKIFDGSISDPSVRTLVRIAAAVDVPAMVLLQHYAQEPRGTHWRHTLACGLRDPADKVAFAADLSVPDHDWVAPGARFRKAWLIRNAGHVTWQGRRLVRADADLVVAREVHGRLERLLDAHLMSLGRDLPIPDLAPGMDCELSMDFRAPEKGGTAASLWRIVDATGAPCFPASFFLQVVVTVVTH